MTNSGLAIEAKVITIVGEAIYRVIAAAPENLEKPKRIIDNDLSVMGTLSTLQRRPSLQGFMPGHIAMNIEYLKPRSMLLSEYTLVDDDIVSAEMVDASPQKFVELVAAGVLPRTFRFLQHWKNVIQAEEPTARMHRVIIAPSFNPLSGYRYADASYNLLQ